MDNEEEFEENDVARASEGKGQAEDDGPLWDDDPDPDLCVDLHIASRGYSDALLELSAELSLREREHWKPHCSSGWEDAVHGWSRGAGLGCLFPPQRMRRDPKNDGQTPHCLLCVDMRPPEALSLDRAPEFCPESQVSPEHRGVNNATPSGLPTVLYSNTARSALLKEPAQCPGGHQHHFLLREKMADDTADRDVPWHINFNSKHVAIKDRHYDLGLPINIFPVLPPVRTPHLKSQRVTQQVNFGESVAGGSSEVGSVEPWSTSESRGVARTEEVSVTRPSRSSRDTYRAIGPPTPMYNPPSQENQQSLTMFTVPGYEMPLSDIGDTAHHRTTISVDKHWKQMGSDDRRHVRSTTPQLPILFGTKLPILSGQRRTYLNTPLLCSQTP